MGVGAACTRLQPLVTRPALPSLVLKGLGCRLLARCRAMAYAAGVGVRWLFGTLGVVSPDSLLEAPQTLFSELSPQGGLACLLGSEIGATVLGSEIGATASPQNGESPLLLLPRPLSYSCSYVCLRVSI